MLSSTDSLTLLLAERERRRRRTIQPAAPDVARWINDCITIEDPHGTDIAIIPFHLWPEQATTLATLRDHSQVIVLKARQLGMSWLTLAYALWLCLFRAGQTVLVFSKDQDSANEMVRRARGMFLRLVDKPVALTVDNVQTIAWANGSRIKSFAATEDAGSSFTASLTILDEFAKMRYAGELYTAVKPTVNDGGQIVIISTAKGEQGIFHQIWQNAVKGLNGFKAVFLPWSVRPGRDASWYAQAEADAVTSAHHRQEYPATAEEAFTYVGEDRFLPSMTLWDALREDLPALGPREPMVLCADAGVSGDSFGVIGVTRHPARPADVAPRYVREWRPPKGGQIDFGGPEGPDSEIRRLCGAHAVVQFCYDPYQLVKLAQDLTRDGVVWCKAFSQGADRLEADKQLLDLIIHRRLAHDGHADLRRHVDNANRKPDPETRKLRIVKREAGLKIDLCVALSMASYECLRLSL